MLDRKFFRDIAPNVTARFRKHIFGTTSRGVKARQVDGKEYGPYTTEYNTLKKSGLGRRQDKEYKNSNAPVFTGDTQRQFAKFRPHSNGFKFGTTRGGIVKSLANRGRVISSDNKPLPKPVEDYIIKTADRYVNKKLGKVKDFYVSVGK